MADPHINPHLSIDEDNKTRDNKLEDSKPPIPKTQALDTTLARLITIDKDFTEVHAVQTISQIIILWPDLSNFGCGPYEIYSLSRVLRQANIVVEQGHLRAFLVAWVVLDTNFPSLEVTHQVKLARDMVVCQLGAVEKEVTGDREKMVTTPRMKADGGTQKEYAQALSPASPSKILSKTHKRWVRQRQLKGLITQAEKLKKRKRKREEEAENDDTATHIDGVTATSMDDDESEITMEPIVLSTPEKTALTLQKLERKRKLEALGSKHKKRRYL